MPIPWPMTVAKAEPAMPRPIARTSKALSMRQAMVPSTLVASERLGRPAVRRKLFMPMPSDWNTKPISTICKKTFVGSHSSPAAPSSTSKGSMRNVPTIAAKTPMMTKSDAVLPMIFSTRALSPLPSSMAASALPPMPATIEQPMRMLITGNASCVTAAPMPGMAICRNTVSMMLYKELKIIMTMAGAENSTSNLPMRSLICSDCFWM